MTMVRAVLGRPAARMAAAGLMLATAVTALLVAGPLDKEWLYWRASYAELGVGAAEG